MSTWKVLVVDDAEDIHQITRLALRRKSWLGRAIAVTSARSGAEARAIIESDASFACALVDVVMETDTAGLELCEFIRLRAPRTMRIILRTGQAGAAPAERVMNDYDIDYYLAKTEVTEERLYATLRACFRASQDIAALITVSSQLKALTLALQDPASTRQTLAGIMEKSLTFLEEKYGVRILFANAELPAKMAASEAPASTELDMAAAQRAVARAIEQSLPPMQLSAGPTVGLPEDAFVVVATALSPQRRAENSLGERMKRWLQGLVQPSDRENAVGFVGQWTSPPSARRQTEFLQDLELLVSNWRVADSSLRLQDSLARERIDQINNKQSGQP
jgi:CheY-like chemotaxis protein